MINMQQVGFVSIGLVWIRQLDQPGLDTEHTELGHQIRFDWSTRIRFDNRSESMGIEGVHGIIQNQY